MRLKVDFRRERVVWRGRICGLRHEVYWNWRRKYLEVYYLAARSGDRKPRKRYIEIHSIRSLGKAEEYVDGNYPYSFLGLLYLALYDKETKRGKRVV